MLPWPLHGRSAEADRKQAAGARARIWAGGSHSFTASVRMLFSCARACAREKARYGTCHEMRGMPLNDGLPAVRGLLDVCGRSD